MDNNDTNERLWVMRYRPTTIDQCIVPQAVKDTLQGIVNSGDIPNMIFAGSPGTSKTTCALAIVKQLGLDYLMINTSLENGIDVLRTKITNYVSSVSLNGKIKVVVFDEADYASQAFQPALRGFIEKFSDNCRFIFTCNYANRIIDPIKSRCNVIEFAITPQDKKPMTQAMLKRCIEIAKENNVKFDPKAIAKIVVKNFPDFRKVINELQRSSIKGTIVDDQLIDNPDDIFHPVVESLRTKNFKEMRQWVAINRDIGPEKVFEYFYQHACEIFQPQSVPQLVITTAEYQYKSAFAADQEINTAAYLTELMSSCQTIE